MLISQDSLPFRPPPLLLRERRQIDVDQLSGSREAYRADDASAFEVSFLLLIPDLRPHW
jgi:hypothetical protein